MSTEREGLSNPSQGSSDKWFKWQDFVKWTFSIEHKIQILN